MTTSAGWFCGSGILHADAAALWRLLVLAPLLEEWVVRAGLQDMLLRRVGADAGGARAAALWLPAAAFSALHLARGPMVAVQVFLPGLLLGFLYERTRDWRRCAVLHALMNASALSICAVSV